MRIALTVFFAMHAVAASLAISLPVIVALTAGRRPRMAQAMTMPALVSLSTAVVMGVAALLFISRAWPRPFVASAVALFVPLLSVVPLLSIAFASMYAYQIRGWRPGPWVCGAATLAIGAIFAAISAKSVGPSAYVRMAHFLPAAASAAGVAVMVRFAGEEEARLGARLAFAASLVQAATGVVYLFSLPVRPGGALLWMPIGSAAGLIAILGLQAFGPRVTRWAAWATAAGFFFVVLAMAALREGVRGLAL